ncbi:Serpin domain-containing protein [Hirschfeldia incana]|nr:Serpin domain-containing protein [Hirschfeldia incana]
MNSTRLQQDRFHFFADHSANGGPKISSLNGVWIEKTRPIDSSFKDLFENVFKAVFDRVEFRSKAEQVRRELNKWAEDHTNGLIKDILPPGSISSQTDCVYGNALYFKGAWQVPFAKSSTRDREFHLLNGTSVAVPFMSSYENQ